MNNNSVVPMLVLLASMSGIHCMETGILGLLHKIDPHFERQEDFIARTKKLPAMYCYNKPKNGFKIQFNALNKRGIELSSVICYDTQSVANRITLLHEDLTPLLRWDLKSNDVVAAAISCDGNMLATIHEYKDKDKQELFWNLWKILFSGRLERMGERRIIMGAGWHRNDIMPESIDFNKQGDAVIVWGIPMIQGLTPRNCKIYSLSGVSEDIVEPIELDDLVKKNFCKTRVAEYQRTGSL